MTSALERRQIRQAYAQANQVNVATALATVVRTTGSTYRKAGAKMLIAQDGTKTGIIGGGCFDDALVEQAHEVIVERHPRLCEYDLTDALEAYIGFNKGCSGTVSVLLEALPAGMSEQAIDKFIGPIFHTEDRVVATIYAATGRYDSVIPYRLTCGDATGGEPCADPELDELLRKHGSGVRDKKASMDAKLTIGDEVLHAHFEYRPRDLRVNIFGAGPDALPIYRLAVELGWAVRVFDHRPAYARAADFPDAMAVHCVDPEASLTADFDAREMCVVMSHNFLVDAGYLAHILPLKLPYIGVLGPSHRTQRLWQELETRGLPPELLQARQNVYAPVGLDLGASNPQAIALAILAEIQTVSKRGGTQHLRVRAAASSIDRLEV